jgi:hypothetical protein
MTTKQIQTILISHECGTKQFTGEGIPAILYTDGSTSDYVSLDKDECKAIWTLAMDHMIRYHGQVGSAAACGVLGFLEDAYPENVAEFEKTLDS